MAGSVDGAVNPDRGVFAGMLANRFGSGRVVLFGGLSYTLGVGLSALAYEPCLETVRHCGYLMLTGGYFRVRFPAGVHHESQARAAGHHSGAPASVSGASGAAVGDVRRAACGGRPGQVLQAGTLVERP